MAINLSIDPSLAGDPRPRVGPGLAVGITEAMIREVVDAFYSRIRNDAVLGPIFEERIGAVWEEHLGRMYDFWSSVLLMTGRFKGAPMRTHALMADRLEDKHFAHWLTLFEATVRDVCPASAAELFLAKARIIAASLQAGMAFQRGDSLLAP